MASWSGGLLNVRRERREDFLEEFLTRAAGVSVRIRRSWPCLARPPSGVSKMRLSS